MTAPPFKRIDEPFHTCITEGMETPLFPFRLKKETQHRVREVAKIYGSPNPSAFLREMIDSLLGGNQRKTMFFLQELGSKLSDQMSLELIQAQKAAIKPRKSVKRVKGGAKHDRTT